MSSFDDEARSFRHACDQRSEQREARSGIRCAQEDLRCAQLRAYSAMQRLENLNRPDLVSDGVILQLGRVGETLAEVQTEVRAANARIDIEAEIPLADPIG